MSLVTRQGSDDGSIQITKDCQHVHALLVSNSPEVLLYLRGVEWELMSRELCAYSILFVVQEQEGLKQLNEELLEEFVPLGCPSRVLH